MITSPELKAQLETGSTNLIDVRLEEDYFSEHIPDAVNNCVFEVEFLSRMQEAGAVLTTPLCVYGASENSHESRMAAEKLKRAGYEQVVELREGLEGWKKAGHETVFGAPLEEESPISDGSYPVDLSESRVEWLGRNLINKHWGTIPLQSGTLRFSGGHLEGGEFVLDMTAMKCTDLEGSEMHDVLIHHLQSDDFFDTELFPEARLVIDRSEALDGYGAGEPNLRLHGKLSLKGVTRGISFKTTAGITDAGKPAAQSVFSIDRTKWNVIYGSGKFFKRLAGHLVNDLIELQIRVITE